MPGKEAILVDLLAQAFDNEGLRRWIGLNFPRISQELPGHQSSLAELAFQAVSLLSQRGLLNVDFFQNLLNARSALRLSVESVAKAWGVSVDASVTHVQQSSNSGFIDYAASGGGTPIVSLKPLVTRSQNLREVDLVWIHPPGPNLGRRWKLIASKTYSLGRVGQNVDIAVESDTVSRDHAKIFTQRSLGGLEWMVEDMDSTNGTFVAERKVLLEQLHDGALVRFGDVVFKFLGSDNVELAYYEEIYKKTTNDPMTGVYNKSYCQEFLSQETVAALSRGQCLSCVVLDIDRLAYVNKEHGVAAGDWLLKKMVNRLRSHLRVGDLLARVGDDEFALILVGMSLQDAVVVATRTREAIVSRPFRYTEQNLQVTVSLGIAELQSSRLPDASAMLQCAYEHLAMAKRRRDGVFPMHIA